MENEFLEVQKLLQDEDLPEFISYLPKEIVPRQVKDKLESLNTINIAEISKNNGLLEFLTDFSFVPVEINLDEIAGLLSKYESVSVDFFKEKKMEVQQSASYKSEFQTAANTAGVEKPKNESNMDEALLQRIKSEILETDLNLTWDQIVGLKDVKKAINEIVLWPMMRPDLFVGLRGPPKGLLLFGPPGTGKTMIGKCIASQCNATFFSISASSLTSKWLGESEKMVRAMFFLARKMAPSVIFIDEIDSLLSQRSENENEASRKIKTEFLVQFDGAAVGENDRILIIGATNRPQEIDDAARRRLVKRIYVPLPEYESRIQMIQQLIREYPNHISEQDFKELGSMTDGYSGSDLFNLCREASLEPLREVVNITEFKKEDTRPIEVLDFIKAMKQIRKSVSVKDLKGYVEWNDQFGSMQCCE